MSTASLAHEQQEPTPIHTDALPEQPYDGMCVAHCGYRHRQCPDCRPGGHAWALEQYVGKVEEERKLERNNKESAPPPSMPASLTATERSAFLGLQAQARQYEQAINEQERAIVAEIEARLGLDVGAIGKSHTVSAQTWQVVAMPQQDGDTPDDAALRF